MPIHKLGKHLVHHEIRKYMLKSSKKALQNYRSVLQYYTRDYNEEKFYMYNTFNNYITIPFLRAKLLKITPSEHVEAITLNSTKVNLPCDVKEGDQIAVRAKDPIKKFILLEFIFELI